MARKRRRNTKKKKGSALRTTAYIGAAVLVAAWFAPKLFGAARKR